MGQPLFSILTVTLNPGQALERTVASVKAQSFTDYEHIIKDACSTDGSIQKFAQPDGPYQPTVIRKKDGGIYDAMNQAIAHANGQYLLFLNAGDALLDAQVLADVSSTLAANHGVDLAYGDYIAERIGTTVLHPRRLSAFYLFRHPLCHQACYMRREVAASLGGFDTSIRVLADFDLLLRLVRGGRGSYVHCGRTVVRYMGEGFSERPDLAKVIRKELRLLWSRHFSRSERVLYRALWMLTLPKIRHRLLGGNTPLARTYTRIVNLWRR